MLGIIMLGTYVMYRNRATYVDANCELNDMI